VEQLEIGQRRLTEGDLENMTCEQRLKDLDSFILENQRLRGRQNNSLQVKVKREKE